MSTAPEQIEVPIWVKEGIMTVRRDALEPEDPDHPANYIRNVLGLDPTHYGYDDEPVRYCCCCGQIIRGEP